jgi:CheY-like chemotaxis protein
VLHALRMNNIEQPMKKNLLLVDDNPQWRRLVRQSIGERANVSECPSGSEALKAISVQQPDWVLMDLEMADGDGLTTTRQIKHLHPGTRVAIVTQHTEDFLHQAALKAGADTCVSKDHIFWLINTILGSEQPTPALKQASAPMQNAKSTIESLAPVAALALLL